MKSLAVFLILCFVAGGGALAIDVGEVQELKGKVRLKEPGRGWEPASVGKGVAEQDFISTGFRSNAVVDLGSSLLAIKELTRLQVLSKLST